MNTETQELNLTHLAGLLRMSKSLVFVPDRATAKIVRKACHALGLPSHTIDPRQVSFVTHFESDKENFATIAAPEVNAHKWYSLAEQVIWVGPLPETSDSEVMRAFEAALARASNNRATCFLENWGSP